MHSFRVSGLSLARTDTHVGIGPRGYVRSLYLAWGSTLHHPSIHRSLGICSHKMLWQHCCLIYITPISDAVITCTLLHITFVTEGRPSRIVYHFTSNFDFLVLNIFFVLHIYLQKCLLLPRRLRRRVDFGQELRFSFSLFGHYGLCICKQWSQQW